MWGDNQNNQGWGQQGNNQGWGAMQGQGQGTHLFVPGNYYTITSKNANKVIDICQDSDRRGLAIIWQGYGGQNQRFAFDPVGDGTYQIRSQQSGKVLTVAASNPNDGTQVIEQAFCSIQGQKWTIKPLGNTGQFVIISQFGKALDCCEESTSNGTRIIQWQPSGKANQTWLIRPA